MSPPQTKNQTNDLKREIESFKKEVSIDQESAKTYLNELRFGNHGRRESYKSPELHTKLKAYQAHRPDRILKYCKGPCEVQDPKWYCKIEWTYKLEVDKGNKRNNLEIENQSAKEKISNDHKKGEVYLKEVLQRECDPRKPRKGQCKYKIDKAYKPNADERNN